MYPLECNRLIISIVACFDRAVTTLQRDCLPHVSTDLKSSKVVLFFLTYGVIPSEFAILGSEGA